MSKSRFVSLVSVGFVFLTLSVCGTSFASHISAKSAILVDIGEGKVIYAKKPDMKLFPASTTKIVTAMVVLDNLSPDVQVIVSPSAARVSSIKPRLKEGQIFKVSELLYLALMKSINSAAVALAESVAGSEKDFVRMMNEKARSLDAANTVFANATGLPGGRQYTTARDLAKILEGSLKYPLISEIISTRVKKLYIDGKPVFLKNTNYLLWTDDDQIGGKTGYTASARHCFVGATRKGDRTLIIALLGERVRENLWNDAMKLFDNESRIIKTESN